ncbi:MAG TPA: Zn-dependent hydrolase [Candidatus Paenibacillus intestinavium]|nr:Zn-dependent hydrolase [Candidatus Paenibacillus intestinavium]
MTINRERLWHRIIELGSIGQDAESGGVTRFSFTSIERRAKDQVTEYMQQAGLIVREDSVGNLIGRYEGLDEHAPAVVTGSHIDTVAQGGMFDGALGVLAAIEVLQSMHERDQRFKHPIEVIAFSDEEGSRFGFGMIGSRAFAGTLKQADLIYYDEQHITIAEAMRSAGYSPEHIDQAARASSDIKCYVELHIEQGKVLESLNQPVGIVTGIAGPLWQQFTLTGQAGHAGATPMLMRRDPMHAATAVLDFIYNEVRQFKHGVATVGKFRVLPGGINIIPNEVQFTLDLRDIDEADRNELEQRITEHAQRVCTELNIDCNIELLQRVAPAPSSPHLIGVIDTAAQQLGMKEIPRLVSGAGHDGMQFQALCPIAMLFVRSKDGISHNPKEWSSIEDCEAGADLLYYTLKQLASESY